LSSPAQPSGPKFVASVLRLEPRLAVFDCDGTLWSGDAGADFFYWEIERGLLPREVAAWALPRYDAYKAGQVDEETMCGEMVTIHQGLSEAELERAAEDFFREKVAMHIFPSMQELTMELVRRGCEIWAVSSTNEWVVRAGARRFGFRASHVLAASVEVVGGCATQRLRRVPTGEGKARVIRELLPPAPIDAAFGNTVHDIAMLSLARHAFAISPDSALERLAHERGWTVYHPAAPAV